jgi:hypothetical protein
MELVAAEPTGDGETGAALARGAGPEPASTAGQYDGQYGEDDADSGGHRERDYLATVTVASARM